MIISGRLEPFAALVPIGAGLCTPAFPADGSQPCAYVAASTTCTVVSAAADATRIGRDVLEFETDLPESSAVAGRNRAAFLGSGRKSAHNSDRRPTS